ncbi:acyl-CoA dehydrogenase family protein [Paenarthrobacter nicotinovorans]|jgi:alkylation response protein AidB-like acyl-CoA dehydrogenase|uniref:acyl-CoA dehydrogenase family protein n=1 Tax=Paenarthrobacter nicotinovorans TaxID=29320 RepID=UPI001667F962|nr:acyl-CoA dehydrogenase family protein [Paenarthrobacter nicotinovorans]MBP2394531.1 alkylation response protein AidB-like acyl-CoA dehydrogenase [Paenarthrobacter nicotinovorans]UKE99283.1 acyl-CoA dehydrogenase family protein [Paenarthrobacter nicotinovorans]UKF04064.1 acyl-CoA dehydrogenase family protein [Paenarthrobacter nicotinovorans]GGV40025.1 acyl-CoA dehydrogenase [Paenarthrobacter nicotinovorans]
MTAALETELNFDLLPASVIAFRDLAREFAQDIVAPKAIELDQQDADAFDWDVIAAGHDIGLTRALLPIEIGGLGVGVLGVAVAMEELAAACPGIALAFGATMLGQTPVLLSGDLKLQDQFLTQFTGEKAVLACNAVAEEDAGTDLVIPQHFADARMRTTLRREGDQYVLNGHKRFITNGAVASFATVYANLEDYPGATGLTCIVVPLDADGVRRGVVLDKMGYRACLGSEIWFDDVRLPAGNLIGGEAQGSAINIAQGNMARTTVAAVSTGIARHAFELARDWCGERLQGGKLLKDHQMTARRLADMKIDVEAARLMYLRSAVKVDSQLPAPEVEPAMAKLFADRVAIDTANTAVALMGSRGYMKEYGLEKVLRDAFGTRIFEGTPEALALGITDCLYRDDDDDF